MLNLVDQFNRYDKNYLSSLAGADLCKRLSGTHSKCHDLSFDLSLTCNSRELIFRINPQGQNPLYPVGHMAQSTLSTCTLRHHLHQLLHIQFHLAWPLHLAHLPCLAHQPKLSHLVLHPFRHLSLVDPTTIFTLLRHSVTQSLSHPATQPFSHSAPLSATQPFSHSATQPLSHTALSHSAI